MCVRIRFFIRAGVSMPRVGLASHLFCCILFCDCFDFEEQRLGRAARRHRVCHAMEEGGRQVLAERGVPGHRGGAGCYRQRQRTGRSGGGWPDEGWFCADDSGCGGDATTVVPTIPFQRLGGPPVSGPTAPPF